MNRNRYGVPRSGFTIVEIMIVVTIIGILCALAIPKAVSIVGKMKIKQAEADLELLGNAVRQLAWDTGKWPGGSTRLDDDWDRIDLSEGNAGLLSNDGTFPAGKWKGPYLSEIPQDPWGNEYFFDADYYPEGTGPGKRMCAVVHSGGPNGSGFNVYDADNIHIVVHEW